MFAYDYPLLSVFWTVLWIYLIFAWFMLLFSVIADIFRNHEMRGFSKAIWLVVVILIPFHAVLCAGCGRYPKPCRRDRQVGCAP